MLANIALGKIEGSSVDVEVEMLFIDKAVSLKDRFPFGSIWYDVIKGHFVFLYEDKYSAVFSACSDPSGDNGKSVQPKKVPFKLPILCP